MKSDELIEKAAKIAAETTNGGSFYDEKWYTADHRKAWYKGIRSALEVFEASGWKYLDENTGTIRLLKHGAGCGCSYCT